jgi:CelD/BcsL family acetyltransferase involved in cellulose biosynthesis
MQVEVRRDGIDSALGDWERLFAEDPEATPFSSPGWARAWWPHWSASARPWIVVARDAGKPVGIAPLVVKRRGPFRVLSELGRPPGNYWDVVARPSHREAAASAIARELELRSSEWDALVLGCLPPSSAIGAALGASGLRVHRRPPVAYPGIELPSSFEEYLEALPKKRRADLRRHLRRLDEGSLTYREVRDPEQLDAAIDRWQELRVRWWSARGKSLDPEHRATRFRLFMRDAMRLLVPAGLATVWQFEQDGGVLGLEINLVDERRCYAWLDGYDPEFAHLGLGKTAVGEGIRSSIAAGRTYYDFMVGAEAYKYWYGAIDRHCEWLISTTGRPRSRAALAANTIVERGLRPGASSESPG